MNKPIEPGGEYRSPAGRVRAVEPAGWSESKQAEAWWFRHVDRHTNHAFVQADVRPVRPVKAARQRKRSAR